ncbi:16S rRNA (cytidine1402-2'-O)-methyltransferase [Chitinasiproducens palmae]|uniref:Ribosomal RNA small subunit methyltransferase I n=1 Tax=Chitinasiproducens palmae TaxID=1770053 RepID=A0A1H2PQG0_9BURK|nr:16S rRNA (cytidine1402-2'-O)-methyltransferase [Chitinasiproducens palmae]
MVATPIGNLADISLRALHLLALCDRVAAEDTRTTAPLLARYGISKPMLPAHEHNEREAAERVVSHLRAGERIAYVSDAGTPGISDPGARVADAVRAAGLPVVPLPGASALLAAVSVAGPWASPFTFIGFLPTKTKQRAGELTRLATSREALVLYEAPHRLHATVSALLTAFGGARRILVARELTKLHETLLTGTLAEVHDRVVEETPRGEYVIVVEGAPPVTHDDEAQHDRLLSMLLEETSVSAAARLAARLTGVPRDVLYPRALKLGRAGATDDESGDDAVEED